MGMNPACDHQTVSLSSQTEDFMENQARKELQTIKMIELSKT